MQGQKVRSWHFIIGTSQLRETTLTENISPPGWPGVGSGADNPTLEKTLVTKSEEAIARHFSWRKLLRKARAHIGLSSRWWWWEEVYVVLSIITRRNMMSGALKNYWSVFEQFYAPSYNNIMKHDWLFYVPRFQISLTSTVKTFLLNFTVHLGISYSALQKGNCFIAVGS
jgi:hypothetical protein